MYGISWTLVRRHSVVRITAWLPDYVSVHAPPKKGNRKAYRSSINWNLQFTITPVEVVRVVPSNNLLQTIWGNQEQKSYGRTYFLPFTWAQRWKAHRRLLPILAARSAEVHLKVLRRGRWHCVSWRFTRIPQNRLSFGLRSKTNRRGYYGLGVVALERGKKVQSNWSQEVAEDGVRTREVCRSISERRMVPYVKTGVQTNADYRGRTIVRHGVRLCTTRFNFNRRNVITSEPRIQRERRKWRGRVSRRSCPSFDSFKHHHTAVSQIQVDESGEAEAQS